MDRIAEDVPLGPGDIVGGRYRVIQAVGEGPLDRLYEAQDVDRHERVIVRVLRRSLVGKGPRVRAFEDQARIVRGAGTGARSEAEPAVRVLELGRDEELGHFAALSNRESKPVADVLALLAGVDGYEAPPSHPPIPVDGFRFPASESQVKLETLEPPAPTTASEKEQPRFAEPRRPKRLETLELDTSQVSRRMGPRPAMTLERPSERWQLLRRLATLVLVLGAFIAGFYAYTRYAGRAPSAQDKPAPDGDDTDATTDVRAGGGNGRVPAAAREVQLRFQVTPARARMRVQGRIAPGHDLRVPRSDRPFKVRFEAPGHVSHSFEVVPDRSKDVLVVLKRIP